MFKFIHKKKGFSLAEVIITILVLSFIMPLAGQILYQMTSFYQMASYRWQIQNAVQLACRKFETNSELIMNTHKADILYDPVIAGGITVYDDGSFVWRNGAEKSYIVTKEGVADDSDPYTYIFSTPAYDIDGVYLGSYLYIREYNTTNSVLFLDEEGFGDVPVEIEFTVGTSVPSRVTDENGNPIPQKYLSNTVGITLKSGLQQVTNYEVETAYTLIQIAEGKAINYEGGLLVCDYSWFAVGNASTPAAYPAGWANTELNGQSTSGYPGDADGTAPTRYQAANDIWYDIRVRDINKGANVMRFVSEEAFHSVTDTSELASSANMASCLTSWAYMDEDAKEQSVVLGGLRDFRDNVLKGTVAGDWIIYNYYNNWSPFVVNNLAFMKPVIKTVLKPISVICGLLANI